jgi:hypothetical protein
MYFLKIKNHFEGASEWVSERINEWMSKCEWVSEVMRLEILFRLAAWNNSFAILKKLKKNVHDLIFFFTIFKYLHDMTFTILIIYNKLL